MASLIKRPGGHHWIQYKAPNGKRPTIRLGKVNRQHALGFLYRLECLLATHAIGDQPDPATAAWLTGLQPKILDRLVTAGLTNGRTVRTLGDLLERFNESFSGKPSTMTNIAIAYGNLTGHFGDDMVLASIGPAEAQGFRTWLLEHGGNRGGPLATATVSRRTRRARQLFKFAVDNKWLPENPFRDVRGGSETNRLKDFYVGIPLIQKVIDEIPASDRQFLAIVVLARIGAVRCPSEVLPMRWTQINWDRETLIVESPKTAHHPGGESRVIPLWPEIRSALNLLWDATETGETYLFPRYREKTGTALTNQLRAACWAAGEALWQKPWQNMRATRESELLCTHPIHVVTQWLGHSPNVALKHYAQVVKEQSAEMEATPLGVQILRLPVSGKK